MITENGRRYIPAFDGVNEKLHEKLLWEEDKVAKLKKQKYDASSHFQNLNSYKDFIQKVTRINVFSMIFENLTDKEEENVFPCAIIDGNEAWIGQDWAKEYRYFTRESPNEGAIGYTIIDLMRVLQIDLDSISSGYSFWRAREELMDLLNVSFEEDWEKGEKGKYENNIALVKKYKGKKLQVAYPALHNEIGQHWNVIEKVMKSGLQFIMPKKRDERGNSRFVFYSSKSGLSKKEFERFIGILESLELIYVEVKEDTYYDKNCFTYVTKELTFFSFPHYSENLFNKIEEELKNMQQKGTQLNRLNNT